MIFRVLMADDRVVLAVQGFDHMCTACPEVPGLRTSTIFKPSRGTYTLVP